MIWNDTKRDAAASFIRRRDGSRISKALKRQSASRCLSFGPHKHNSRRTKSAWSLAQLTNYHFAVPGTERDIAIDHIATLWAHPLLRHHSCRDSRTSACQCDESDHRAGRMPDRNLAVVVFVITRQAR